MNSYIKLGIAALLPVFATILVSLLETKTGYSKLNKHIRQIICGIVFGGLAVIGTEWGIPMNGAQVNCRDASVIAAGLLFGPEAGIIAGLIGGIERWVAVAWGVGRFTRVACSVSTVIAGIYAAIVRKYLFDNKKPSWIISFAIGLVIEVFHLTMVFVTNMNSPTEAITVVEACTTPMLIANGISVMLSSIAITIINKEQLLSVGDKPSLSQTIQRWLLLVVFFVFGLTTVFIVSLQSKIAQNQTDSYLTTSLNDVAHDIQDAADNSLLRVTKQIRDEIETYSLDELAKKYNVAEINKVNKSALVYESTNPDFVGFFMASGAQSLEFMCLLKGTDTFVQKYGPITFDDEISRKYAGVAYKDGFIQVGYDSDQFQKEVSSIITGITKNRHVGENGFILILDEDYNIVSRPNDDTTPYYFNFGYIKTDGSTFNVKVNGREHYAKSNVVEGYTVISFLPIKEALRIRDTSLYVNTFLEIMVFALLFGMIYQLLRKTVVNKIETVNNSLSKIISGNLDEVVDVTSNKEFVSLSNDINSTVTTLKKYIAEAEARIDKELEFAKAIQSSAVPTVFNTSAEYDIFASMNTAKEVGGDFYDFYKTHSKVLNFLIADVSGKGIPAAMFMMRAKTELRSLTEAGQPINQVFINGNNALCDGNEAGMFVTAWQGRLDLETGAVQFVNAGHNPPLICKNGKFEYIHSKAGFVLAGMEDVPYKIQELNLEKGDILFLYTDGVTEATNINNELFGEDRLIEALNSRKFTSMKEMCEFVKAKVDEFTGEADQFDDITMVGLRYGEAMEESKNTLHLEKAMTEDVDKVTGFVEEILETLEVPMKETMQISVAIDEIFSNIIKHGYKNQGGPVWINVEPKEKSVSITFEDCSPMYNPLEQADPDTTLSAEERNIGGLGIFVVKKTMSDLAYRYENDRNIFTIRKDY